MTTRSEQSKMVRSYSGGAVGTAVRGTIRDVIKTTGDEVRVVIQDIVEALARLTIKTRFFEEDGRVLTPELFHPGAGVVAAVSIKKTIASGAMSLALTGGPKRVFLQIDNESAAAADDLDTINGTRKWDELVVYSVSSARVPTLTSAGNLRVGPFNQFSLLDPKDKAFFINVDGTNLDALSLRNN